LSSPYINRFLQPDSIIPSPANPQSWNRFSYTLNNPIRFNDPTGHEATKCNKTSTVKDCVKSDEFLIYRLSKFNVHVSEGFTHSQLVAILKAVMLVGEKFASARKKAGESASAAFIAVFGYINFKKETDTGPCGDTPGVNSGGCTRDKHNVSFWSMSGESTLDISRMTKNVVHEIGHVYNNQLEDISSNIPEGLTRDNVLRPNLKTDRGTRWDWQQSPSNEPSEIFADMFIAWVYDAWNIDPANALAVDDANNWMNSLVPKP